MLAWAAILPAQADYSTAVLSLNPVGYWRLNEPAGSGSAINIGSVLAPGNAAYIASPTLQQPGAMGTDPAVLLDGASQYASVPFNAAFNPLCNYADIYNCPIPPPENRLPVAVKAGEKAYPHP